MLDQRLFDEIKLQLEDDILSFGWLRQLANTQNSERPESECVDAVISTVLKLHSDRQIVIGNAYESDNTVLVSSWTETNDVLAAKMRSETIRLDGTDDQQFCFWIQSIVDFAG